MPAFVSAARISAATLLIAFLASSLVRGEVASVPPILSAPDVPLPSPAQLMRASASVPRIDRGSELPADWQHGAFAEIFVRAYRDSDGDGVGDLRGLTQSLDYLQQLGVRGLWLMPITPSQDHDHGYAVTDYRDIEPAYGSLSDFDELVRQAHARGIGIVVDYVLNHSAAAHPFFQAAAASPTSRFRAWYMWRDNAPSGWQIMGKDPWVRTGNGAYLAQFSATMPDFDLTNPAVIAFHEDNLRFWLNRGIDGFRFDAVSHLVEHGPNAWFDQPENYLLMGRLRALVQSYPRRYIVCEAARDPQSYAASTACGAAFALDRAPDFAAAAGGNRAAIRRVAEYFRSAPASIATMVSNHDLFAGERLWDQVHGDLAQYRLAAATYLLQPGTPFVFYGEEIGMGSAPGLQGDSKLRVPMSWTGAVDNAGFSSGTPFRPLARNAARQNVAAEAGRADSILAWYRALLELRNRYPSLSRGGYETPFVVGKLMGFRRTEGAQTSWVLINYGKKAAKVPAGWMDLRAGETRQVFPAPGVGASSPRRMSTGIPAAEPQLRGQSVVVYVRS